jgi:hypothetical protein
MDGLLDSISCGGDEFACDADDIDDDEVDDEKTPTKSKVKRARTDSLASKVGCGVLGIEIWQAIAILGEMYEKIMNKACSFCLKVVGSEDPVNAGRTRSWHKPNFEGRICGYCGVAKLKLFPGQGAAAVLIKFQTTMLDKKRFLDFVARLIEHYKSGNKTMKALDVPQQALEKTDEFNVESSTKGKMQLRSTYLGNPGDNGHTVTMARWKDGTMKEVVLMPETPEDMMEVSWNNVQATKHTVVLHDGDLTESAGQVRDLFNERRQDEGVCQLKGTAMTSSSSSGAGVAPQVELAKTSAPLGGENQGQAEQEEPSDDDFGLEILMGTSLGASTPSSLEASMPAKLVAGGSRCGSAASRGSGQGAVPKIGKLSSAPPPLKGGAAKQLANTRRSSTSVSVSDVGNMGLDQVQKQVVVHIGKIDNWHHEFSRAQKASVLALDKAYYKAVKTSTDIISGKSKFLKKDLASRATEQVKTMDIIVKVVKAYKQWTRKGDDQEFLAEHEEARSFASEAPAVVVTYPPCINVSLLEMRFQGGILATLERADLQDIRARFKNISFDTVQGLLTTEEFDVWQPEQIHQVILNIFGAKKDVATIVKMMHAFLSPLPRRPNFSLDIVFTERIQDDLLNMRVAFDIAGFKNDTANVNNLLIEISRSSSDTCKTVTTSGIGTKVLGHLQKICAELTKKEMAFQRIAELSTKADGQGAEVFRSQAIHLLPICLHQHELRHVFTVFVYMESMCVLVLQLHGVFTNICLKHLFSRFT